jgi:2-polyprenyl-3-methyl-5-hydroxy-6-metoxy-1,4-benzoquinol methylase
MALTFGLRMMGTISKPQGDQANCASLDWETVACPLCSEWREEELLAIPAPKDPVLFRLVRCGNCGLGYMNPRPDQASIGHLYPDDYGAYEVQVRPPQRWRQRVRRRLGGLVLSRYYGYRPPLEHWHQKILAALAWGWLRPDPNSLTALAFHGEGRLLDYGCGSGWYARRMQEQGWQVTGMDLSARAAQQAATHHCIKTLVGTLPHPEVADDSFDVITMGAVLEHVHDPNQLIAAAARALRPGGRLVISVPNLASWGFRFFQTDWWGLQLPYHLLHFTPATLKRLVERHGLTIRKLNTQVRAGWLRRSFVSARRNGSPASQRIPARMGKLRMFTSMLARWTGWSDQADAIYLIAERDDREQSNVCSRIAG